MLEACAGTDSTFAPDGMARFRSFASGDGKNLALLRSDPGLMNTFLWRQLPRHNSEPPPGVAGQEKPASGPRFVGLFFVRLKNTFHLDKVY
jgi:hypothetical protein